MKKLKHILLLLVTLCLLYSCGEFEEINLPDKIKIPREGGVVHIRNTDGIYGIGLENTDGEEAWDRRYRFPPDYELPPSFDTITCDWLKLVQPWDGDHCDFYFIAEPNNTGKKRKMYFSGMVFDCQFTRTVEQDK